MSEVTGLPGFILFDPGNSLFLKKEGKEEFESMAFLLTNQFNCVESLRRLCKIWNYFWIELHFSPSWRLWWNLHWQEFHKDCWWNRIFCIYNWCILSEPFQHLDCHSQCTPTDRFHLSVLGFYCIMVPTCMANLLRYLSNWIYEGPFITAKYFMVLSIKLHQSYRWEAMESWRSPWKPSLEQEMKLLCWSSE